MVQGRMLNEQRYILDIAPRDVLPSPSGARLCSLDEAEKKEKVSNLIRVRITSTAAQRGPVDRTVGFQAGNFMPVRL